MSIESDTEFLDYCFFHSETPRCGFVPSHVARLLRLASPVYEEVARRWDAMPNSVINLNREEVKTLVKEARDRLDLEASL